MKARGLWVVGEGQAEFREEELPEPADDEVLVRTRFSGISRGTESLVVGGRVPEALWSTMRAPFQAGAFPWPVKYGYCNVGVVEAGAWPVGTEGFALVPHQDRYVVPATAFQPLPAGLPAERAILAANLETALNVVWDGRIGPADRVSVVGAGVVGSLVAWLAGRIPGTDVQLIDLRAERSGIADALGVRFTLPESASLDRDVVVEASGAAGGLTTALALAGVEAVIVVASWYGAGPIGVPLGEAFHSRRLTLRSSQVGAVPPERAPRFDFRRRLGAALALLAEAPELDALIDGESEFGTLHIDLPKIARSGGGSLCHRIRYPHS
ncbi:MAG: dehydrogenase [Myxococcota bacterium]